MQGLLVQLENYPYIANVTHMNLKRGLQWFRRNDEEHYSSQRCLLSPDPNKS